jgi:hypothetical protein
MRDNSEIKPPSVLQESPVFNRTVNGDLSIKHLFSNSNVSSKDDLTFLLTARMFNYGIARDMATLLDWKLTAFSPALADPPQA